MVTKKLPMRKCTGCGEMILKKDLIRVIQSPEGEISLDLTGRKNGRGAYICRNLSCLKAAIRSKGLERSLKCAIPDDIYDSLEKELTELGE